MPRPRVRTIRHPPSAVPDGERERADQLHPQRHHERRDRAGRHRASVIRPIVFWASFVPWAKASAEDVTHSPRRIERVTPRRARRSDRAATSSPPSRRRPHHRGDGEGDEDSRHSHRTPPVEARPVHGAEPTDRDPGSHQPPDERVRGRRRQPPPPGRQVPRHGSEQRGEQDAQRVGRADADQPTDRVGHGRPGQDRPEDGEDRRQSPPLWPAASRAWPPAPPPSSTSRGSRWSRRTRQRAPRRRPPRPRRHRSPGQCPSLRTDGSRSVTAATAG